MTAEKDPGTSRLNMSRAILLVALFSLLVILGIKYWPAGGNSGIGAPARNIPKEIQLTYLPSDFRFQVDEEDAIAILSNPRRYRREFNQMVYDINSSILQHVANRMNLTAEQRELMDKEYQKQHPYLRNLYYQDFLAINDTTSTLANTWYNRESGSAVDALHAVASKYTCFLVTNIVSNLIQTDAGTFYAKGGNVDTPCGIALNEALEPMIKRMEASAQVQDFSRSKGLLEERVEKVIMELATYEVQSKKGLNKQLQTKLWGFSVSSTDIEISAVSIMKIGFRLDQFFSMDLNPRAKVVTVTLPQPVVLSHAVYPKLDKLDIGWLREVKEVDLNESFNLLREEFLREAQREGVMDKAKAHATEVMGTMLEPMITGFNAGYRIRVVFRDTEVRPDPEFDVRDEFTDLKEEQ